MPQLGSARKIGSTQASALWTRVMLTTAAAAVDCYIRFCCPPLLQPLMLPATFAFSGFVCALHCLRRLRPPPLAAVSVVCRSCRHLRPLPPPTSAALPGGSPWLSTSIPVHHHRPLSPPQMDPLATVTAVNCNRRRPPPLPSAALFAIPGRCRRRRRPGSQGAPLSSTPTSAQCHWPILSSPPAASTTAAAATVDCNFHQCSITQYPRETLK